MIEVHVINGDLSEPEIDAYIAYGREQYPDREICGVDIRLDGEFVDLKYYFQPRFQHVYRATDYLVKTLDVLNDAKRAEYRDKVMHPVY